MKIIATTCAAILIAALTMPATAEPGDGPDRKALFGELHLHTNFSSDANYLGTTATPDDAYEYAKGKPTKHSNGTTYTISRPLDFMAVTDHGEFMGISALISDPNHPLSK